ncbi:2-dehydropantoate 2-reductase [Rhizobacter sp. J219]|uniref:2-dehydropantoate 2-reductase n=1 Tax=Rhizobacter sp. J219 TaxID=2898430 RepID=UPI002150911A|nr:2-dehydropantoate 2-reductase [Rhizobacter sp. J219]MCR5885548.1 2-dehydropantoate 2-reductase [Rhizobacter sp. J219]
MKITVVGLGAVGGLLAARLALAGHQVSALARGRTLQAVRERGVGLRMGGQVQHAALQASDDPAAFGPQDLMLIALKGQALPGLAGTLAPLIGPHTLIVPAMNGVPWWFLQTPALQARFTAAQRQLDSVDPSGDTGRVLPLSQVLGCVVHLTCSQPEPGVVQHGFGDRLIFGEPAGGVSERVNRVASVFAEAGFKAEASHDIRREIWFKLWGNMTMNPVSALTGATADRILDDPLVRGFMLRAMAEAAAVGAQIGCPIEQSGEERLAVARQLGAFKTSMLQDSEANRALEIDAIVTAVHEIGARLGMATPNIDTVLGLVRLMARTRGLYPASV